MKGLIIWFAIFVIGIISITANNKVNKLTAELKGTDTLVSEMLNSVNKRVDAISEYNEKLDEYLKLRSDYVEMRLNDPKLVASKTKVVVKRITVKSRAKKVRHRPQPEFDLFRMFGG